MSTGDTICFLSSSHSATDKRVFDKEARFLADQGFRVVHLCPQSAGEPLGHWRRDGVENITYPRAEGLRGRAAQLFKLYRSARAVDADAYHCNEVDSWVIGAALALLHRKRCIVDIHEDYPSTVSEGRLPKRLKPVAAAAVRLLYRALTPLTDRIVLAKQSVAEDFRHVPGKLTVVRNFTPLAALKEKTGETASPTAAPGAAAPLTIVHLGLFSRMRGWPQLLAALELLGDEVIARNVRLEVIGLINDGSREAFEAEVARLGLTDRVTVRDWMPFADAFALLRRSAIGVVLFQPGIRNHVFALPHKMFDYMLAELPILIPDCAEEIRDIVTDNACGLLVDSADPADIARALGQLLRDPELRARMGRNGKQAVLETYNWEREAAKLLAVYA